MVFFGLLHLSAPIVYNWSLIIMASIETFLPFDLSNTEFSECSLKWGRSWLRFWIAAMPFVFVRWLTVFIFFSRVSRVYTKCSNSRFFVCNCEKSWKINKTITASIELHHHFLQKKKSSCQLKHFQFLSGLGLWRFSRYAWTRFNTIKKTIKRVALFPFGLRPIPRGGAST